MLAVLENEKVMITWPRVWEEGERKTCLCVMLSCHMTENEKDDYMAKGLGRGREKDMFSCHVVMSYDRE